jgi:hypothetical protein
MYTKSETDLVYEPYNDIDNSLLDLLERVFVRRIENPGTPADHRVQIESHLGRLRAVKTERQKGRS